MATLQVRTDQDQIISILNPADNPTDQSDRISGADASVEPFKKIRTSVSSPHTISTCSSWTSVSPSSLALRPTFSVDSSSDEASVAKEKYATVASDAIDHTQQGAALDTRATTTQGSLETPSKLMAERKKWIKETLINNEYRAHSTSSLAHEECCISGVASERRQWVENTLLATDYKPYSTDAREEISKFQGNSVVTSERKRWIESTLLSPGTSSRKNYGSQELPELQQVSSSVAERRKWLSGMTQVKSTAELEEEVRLEIAAVKEAASRRKIEEETRAEENSDDVGDVNRTDESQENESLMVQLSMDDQEKQSPSIVDQGIAVKKEEKSGDTSDESTISEQLVKLLPVKPPNINKGEMEKTLVLPQATEEGEKLPLRGSGEDTSVGEKKQCQALECTSVKLSNINAKRSADAVIGSPIAKKRKSFFKGLVKRITPKRK